MLPYAAIIKDSFREALASRVLWIVVLLITMFLLVLAPLSYTQMLTTDLKDEDIRQWPDVARLLRDERTTSPPLAHIWSMMSEEDRQVVRDFKPLKDKPSIGDVRDFQDGIRNLRRALNHLLDERKLYNRRAWSDVKLTMEGRSLVGRIDELDDEEVRRLNRILIESAFPGLIEPSPATSIRFRYALYGDFGESLPISKQQLASALRTSLPWLIDKGLLSFGLLIAILVTAPIIPQTFDPGSLHLLLSKPVWRSLLYLAKFLGGCAFVLLCATYLFVGLYLLFGWRFGIWEPRLLWCIPIYAFVFAIYYSVSALAGLIWRSAVVSILVAVLFWAICFSVGLGKVAFEGYIEKFRLEKLVSVGDTVFALDRSNTPRIWDAQSRQWKIAFLDSDLADAQPFLSTIRQMPPVVGPVYDPRSDSIVGITVSINNGQQLLASGKREQNWRHVEGPASPLSPVTMVTEPGGAPLVLTNYGIQRVAEEIHSGEKPVKFLGFAVPLRSRGPIEDAGPVPAQTWNRPLAFAIAPWRKEGADEKGGSKDQAAAIFVYSKGTLQRLEKNSAGKYVVKLEKTVETNEDRRVDLAASSSIVLVAHRDGSYTTFDATTFDERSKHGPVPGHRPHTVIGSPDGRFIALLYRNGELSLLDTSNDTWSQSQFGGQRDISAIAFTPESKLLVCDRMNRVLEYDPATLQRERSFSPPLDLQQQLYRYVMLPIYTVFPKPGEFYKTVEHVLKQAEKSEPKDAAEKKRDGDEGEVKESPWAPVWSSLGFMAVMLALGCAYMQWQEF